ncbi:hypothetical protein BD309DRAFT_962861 [Dichomitus squalens]|nr:hypothetical protein BD309DRAFT_962861 [Dichomitus squalens]
MRAKPYRSDIGSRYSHLHRRSLESNSPGHWMRLPPRLDWRTNSQCQRPTEICHIGHRRLRVSVQYGGSGATEQAG